MLSKQRILNSIEIIVWLEYSQKIITEKIIIDSFNDKMSDHKTKEYKYNYRNNEIEI